MDFVVGIEIRTSNNHTLNGVPLTDICDELKGRYPKDFKFTGWHPLCRCHVVTVLKTDEEMERDTQRILSGQEPEKDSVNAVTAPPEKFRDWVKANADRIEKSRNLPYFLQDNPSFLPESVKMLRRIKVGDTTYVIKDLINQCEVVETANGKVYLHPQHGKGEKAENIRIAKWRAECFGEEVILLPNPERAKSADTFNITRSVFEEYKVNQKPTIGSIDNLIRSGTKQADHIILEIDSDIKAGDLANSLQDRVARSKSLMEIRLKVGNAEAVYTREQIIGNGFKIKPEDFHNVSVSRSRGTRAAEAEPITDAKVRSLFGNTKKSEKSAELAAGSPEDNALSTALGIRRGEEMTFEEANELRGNPHYKKGVKYRVNCQSSVVANEARRRGYDVEAFGNTKADWTMPKLLAGQPEIAFMDADGNPPVPKAVRYSGNLADSLNAEMKEVGRYHLRFRFDNAGETGHVITAERLQDGSLRIYDAQNGKLIKDFSEYSNKVKPDSFEYYRVDNLRLNADVVKGAVKPAGMKGDAPRMQMAEIKNALEKGWYGEEKFATEKIKLLRLEDERYKITKYKSGGILEEPTIGRQNGSERTKNLAFAKRLAKENGEQLRLLPIIDGDINRDVYNLKTKRFADFKIGSPKTSDAKSTVQNAIKEGSRQKVSEVWITFDKDVSRSSVYKGLKAALQGDRAKRIEEVIVVFFNGETKRFSVDSMKKAISNYKRERPRN